MNEEQAGFLSKLSELTAIDGVSGHESAVVRYLADAMEPLVDSVEVDPMGNLYAHKGGGSGPHLMIEAHSDEIGALVSAIEEDGFLRFTSVGGLGPAALAGRKVRVSGNLGVVGIRPGHFARGDGSRTLPEVEEMFIDLGCASRQDVLALGVLPGDPVAQVSELEAVAGRTRVVGKAVDNRVGCLIVLETLRALRGETLPGPLTAVIAVQEETGLKGARVAGGRTQPDAAVVIDTVPCADTPDARHVSAFPVGLGRGPIFQVSSGPGGSGQIMPAAVRDHLVKTASDAGIPYQLATFYVSETDGSALRDLGIPTAVVTVPRRYSHSPVEMLDLGDALATLRLTVELVNRASEFPRGIL